MFLSVVILPYCPHESYSLCSSLLWSPIPPPSLLSVLDLRPLEKGNTWQRSLSRALRCIYTHTQTQTENGLHKLLYPAFTHTHKHTQEHMQTHIGAGIAHYFFLPNWFKQVLSFYLLHHHSQSSTRSCNNQITS